MTQLTIKTFPKYRPNITLKDIVEGIYSTIDYTPNNKEIRLAIDLVKQYKQQELDLFELNSNDAVRSVLQCDISNERINAIKPFKKILFEKRIIYKDGKHQIAKILRKRS